MDRAGRLFAFFFGIVFVLSGAVLTVYVHQNPGVAGNNHLGPMLVLAGCGIAGFGLIHYFRYRDIADSERIVARVTLAGEEPINLDGPDRSKESSLEFRALVRSLIAAAEHTGPLTVAKLDRLKLIMQAATKTEYADSYFTELAGVIRRENVPIEDFLVQYAVGISPEIRRFILWGVVRLLAEEGPVRPAGEVLAGRIGRALQADRQEIVRLLADVATVNRPSASA